MQSLLPIRWLTNHWLRDQWPKQTINQLSGQLVISSNNSQAKATLFGLKNTLGISCLNHTQTIIQGHMSAFTKAKVKGLA
jgi:hypothetical protein